MLGDSLTQLSFEGWGATLANRYQRRADMLNRGCSGYNTRWYLRYADDNEIWNERNVALVTVFFGANDAALKDLDGKHVPVEEYQENLRALVQKARTTYPQSKLLLIAPPPVHREQRLAFQKERYGDKATGIPERTLEHTKLYAVACKRVAEDLGVPCLNLFSLMLEATDDFGRFLSDGLHFNRAGHDFVGEHVLQAIEKYFPELGVRPDPVTGQPNNAGSTCQTLESSGPYHDEIDDTRWEVAFDKRKKK